LKIENYESEYKEQRYQPDMLETELRTLLSQPSQSIFTLISTVCNTKGLDRKFKIRICFRLQPPWNTFTYMV